MTSDSRFRLVSTAARKTSGSEFIAALFMLIGLFSLILFAGMFFSAGAGQKSDSAKAAITVGPNYEVSVADHAEPHDEVLIGTNPLDANQVVACTMVGRNKLGIVKMHTTAYTSGDGGATWLKGPDIPQTGDPICGYAPDGAVYFGAIVDTAHEPTKDWYLKIFRSTDNGKKWEPKTEFLSGDRPWLAFDDSNGPNRGWMYINFQSRAGSLDPDQKSLPVSLTVTHSTDGGTTWSLPRVYGVIANKRINHSIPVGMEVLSDGSLVMLNWQNFNRAAHTDEVSNSAYWEMPPGLPTCEMAVVIVPTDAWKRPKTSKVSDKFCADSSVRRPWAAATSRTTDALAVDAHSAVFKDRIYVAWTDARGDSTRIMFSYSADRGETWSKAMVVDDVPANLGHDPDNFMPALAVNKDGVVGLSWDDRRESPDNLGFATRFTASLDGGETWLPSVRVADQSARFLQGAQGEVISGYYAGGYGTPGAGTLGITRAGEFHAGDTAGLRADANGGFHALWVDNRSGISEVYTAAIHVKGDVAVHGSAEFAKLKDISDRVSLELSDLQYDPKTGAIVVEGSLRNDSKEPLHGRLLARTVSLQSEAGVPTIVNADNGEHGTGAVFDFTSLMTGGVLKPDENTKSRTIKFELKDVKLPAMDEKRLDRILRLGFVTMDVQMLGEVPDAPPGTAATAPPPPPGLRDYERHP
jgi:hypothetical protein